MNFEGPTTYALSAETPPVSNRSENADIGKARLRKFVLPHHVVEVSVERRHRGHGSPNGVYGLVPWPIAKLLRKYDRRSPTRFPYQSR